MRCLACRLAKHPREISWTQIHSLGHFQKRQVVFHFAVHQFCNPPQACWTQSSSQLSRRSVPAFKGINQCSGNRLLNGIQKQSPTRKPCNSFCINRLDQRSQSHVNHFAPVPKFNGTAYSLTGGCQGGIGNAEEQTLLVAASHPSFRMTRKKSDFTCLERYSLHRRTPRPNLDGALPQHHGENMLILHSHVGLSNRSVYIHHYFHCLPHSLLVNWMS